MLATFSAIMEANQAYSALLRFVLAAWHTGQNHSLQRGHRAIFVLHTGHVSNGFTPWMEGEASDIQ